MYPLFQLLKKDAKWHWNQHCVLAFKKIKVLTHYDSNIPIKLTTDASAYGIAAVLSHVFNDRSGKADGFRFQYFK